MAGLSIHDVLPGGEARAAQGPDAPRAAGAAWRWIHLDLSDAAAAPWLRAALPDLAAEALLAAETRPRCEWAEEGLILTLRAVNPEPGGAAEDMVSVRLWMAGDLVMTAGWRPAGALEALRAAARAGRAPETPGALVAALAEGLTRDIEAVTLELDDRADELEDALTAAEGEPEDAADLPLLRRRAIALRRYLVPQREALDRLGRLPAGALGKRARDELRESANRAARALEEIDSARDRLAALADHVDGIQRARMERHNYLLAIVAAIFLPLNFLAGLFGVNLAGMPFAERPWGFAALAGLCLAIGIGLWLFFRRRRWWL